MSASSVIAVFLAEKSRAYQDGYAARTMGKPISAFPANGIYVGPFAKEGWETGWRDADSGKTNFQAPAAPAQSTPRFWVGVAVVVSLLVFMSWLHNLNA